MNRWQSVTKAPVTSYSYLFMFVYSFFCIIICFLCKSPDTQSLMKATSRCGLQLFLSRGRCHHRAETGLPLLQSILDVGLDITSAINYFCRFLFCPPLTWILRLQFFVRFSHKKNTVVDDHARITSLAAGDTWKILLLEGNHLSLETE